MFQVFMGSLTLSIIHALIPNHWLPLIAVGKTEKWSTKRSLWAAVITGIAHTLSTITIGIIVGLVGFKLANSYEFVSNTVAPAILIGLGIIYIILDFRRSHTHTHLQHHQDKDKTGQTTWFAVLTSLSVAMFFTPCIEIEAYYFQAGTIGWIGIFIVSAVYLVITILVMLILVFLGMKDIRTFNSPFLEHHEKSVTGTVLICLGILAILVKF